MEKILNFDNEAITQMDKRYRANLINSLTGYKSANLIGTVSKEKIENLAIFSSVVHIGSNPALLGFIMRPVTAERHTYTNLKEVGEFTVNHVHKKIFPSAHQTAARYDKGISEFNATGLTAEYKDHFPAPFVKEAHIKMACTYVNEYTIKENGTILIIGAIKNIYIPEKTLTEDGWVNLEIAQGVAISGLDGYSLPSLLDRFTYAKPEQPLASLIKK